MDGLGFLLSHPAALVAVARALDGNLEVLAFDLDFVHARLGNEFDQVLYFFLGHGLCDFRNWCVQSGKVTAKIMEAVPRVGITPLLPVGEWPI